MASTYSFRLTAEGWQQFAADMQKLGAESDVAARAFERLRAASPALQSAMERAEQTTQRTTDTLQRHAVANDNAAQSQNRLRVAVQQAGFQVTDFFTQVASGQSAMTAFAQQGGQILQFFGPGGVIAAVGLTAAAVAAKFLDMGESAEAAAKRIQANFEGVKTGQEELGKAIEEVNKLWRSQSANALAAAEASRRAVGQILSMNEDQLVQRNEGNALDLSQAQRDLRDFDARQERRRAETFARTGSRVSDADTQVARQRFELQARVDGLEADIGRVSSRLTEVQEARRRLATAPPVGAEDYGPGAGDAWRTEQQRRREAERDGRRGAAAADSAQRRAEADANALQNSWENFWDKAEQKAEDRVGKEEEARLKAAEREEERRQQSFDRTVERYSQQLSTGVTDALFDGFKNGESAMQTLANALQRALRTAVASALDTEFIRPLLASLLGGASPSLSGVGGASSSSSISGFTNLLGLGDIGSQIRSSLGLNNLGSISSVGNWINDVGQSSGLFGNGISPAMQGPTQSGAPLGSLSQSGLFGSGTAMQAIGGIGLGFGAGSMAGSLVSGARGTQGPGGTLGALGGAGLGFLFGGPIGALIGGVAGGVGGGFIGPTKKGLESRSGVAGIYSLTDEGYLKIQDVGGKRADEAGFTANLQSQLNEINAALQSRGLALGYGGGAAWSVGTGKAAAAAGVPSSIDLNQFSSMVWAPGGGNVGTALNAVRGQDFNSVLSTVDWVTQVYEPLVKASQAGDEFQSSIDALAAKFDGIISRAQELGLATDALVAQRDKEIDAIKKQRDAQNGLSQTSQIANSLFQDLAFGGNSSLTPESQYFAAVSSLRRAGSTLAGGGDEALANYTNLAQRVLPVARSFLGTSQRYGDLVAEVSRTVRSVSPNADTALASLLESQSSGTAQLLEVTASYGAQQVDVLRGIRTEISQLGARLDGLVARLAAA